MPPLPSPEKVIPLALARERIPVAPAARTQEQNLAASMVAKVDEGAFKKALEIGRRTPIQGEKIGKKVEQIGIERDIATGAKVRTPAELARYNEAKAEANLVTKYLEKGLDDPSLTIGERAKLHDKVLAEAKLRPELYDQLFKPPATQAHRDAWARRMLTDPALSAKIRTFLIGHSDSPELADAVTPAQSQHEEANSKHVDAKAEVDDVDRRLAPVDTQLAGYARPRMGALGAKAQEMENIRRDLPTLQANLKTRGEALEIAKEKQTDYELEVAESRRGRGRTVLEVQADLDRARADVRRAQNEVNVVKGRIDRLTDLENEEKRLDQEKTELGKEKREKSSVLKKAELELQKRRQELQDAKALRTSQEQDLVNGFKSIVGEATNEVLNEQIAALEQNYNTELEKLKEQTPDLNEKAMYDALQNRWLGPERKRRVVFGFGREEKYRPINRVQVNDDMVILMNQGPEEVMSRLLVTQINSATGANYTTAEADAIVSDKAYREKMEPEVAKQLLGRRILTGGLSQEDIHIIVNAKWGQGMIDGAIAKNKEFRTAVEGVLGEGALSRQGFGERFRQVIRTNPWLLLLLLLGAPAYALAGPLVGAGAAAFAAGGGVGAGAAAFGVGARAAGMAPMEEQIAA